MRHIANGIYSFQFLEHVDKSFSWLMTSWFEKFHVVRVPQFGLYFENPFFAVALPAGN